MHFSCWHAVQANVIQSSIKPPGAVFTGTEQEALALEAGFHAATHHEIAFGLMGVLVATKPRAGIRRS